MSQQTEPRIVQRLCGGFLALSPDSEPIKIGVLGDTAENAAAKFEQSLTAWRRLGSKEAVVADPTTAQSVR
jgi:hypothetical protein